MPQQQHYIVTSRGQNRQYGILVTVDSRYGPDLHKIAHEKAQQLSYEIRSYGTEISAFAVGPEKAAHWSTMESDYEAAEAAGNWEAARTIRVEQHKFLNSL